MDHQSVRSYVNKCHKTVIARRFVSFSVLADNSTPKQIKRFKIGGVWHNLKHREVGSPHSMSPKYVQTHVMLESGEDHSSAYHGVNVNAG